MASRPGTEPVTVGIVAFNDFHGAIEPPNQSAFIPDGKGGMVGGAAGGAALSPPFDAPAPSRLTGLPVLASTVRPSSAAFGCVPGIAGGVIGRIGSTAVLVAGWAGTGGGVLTSCAALTRSAASIAVRYCRAFSSATA